MRRIDSFLGGLSVEEHRSIRETMEAGLEYQLARGVTLNAINRELLARRDAIDAERARAREAEARAERYRKALEQIRDGEPGATFSGSQCADIARAALRGEG